MLIGLIIIILVIAAIEIAAIRFVYRRTGSGLTACAVASIVAVLIAVIVVGADGSTLMGRFLSSPVAEQAANRYTKESSVLRTVFADHPDEMKRFISVTVETYRSEGPEPALEAMAVGAPVVASNIPVHKEVLGPHACFFEVDDADSLVDAILRSESRSDSVHSAAAHHAQTFTWARSAQSTLDHVA